MRLRSHLMLLSMATAAPAVVLAAVIAVVVVRQERQSVRDAATDRVFAMMSAVDAELRGSLDTVRALAASSHLETGDLRAFHAEAARVLATHPDWQNVTLATAEGTRIANAASAFGTQRGPVADRESFDLALNRGEPVVGNVSVGPAGNFAVPVRVPVLREGAVRYVLTAVVKPDAFGDVLRAQRLPEGWVVNLVDGKRNVIARVPHVPAGSAASESFRAAIQREPQGWFRGRTLEGRDTYTPYVTSPLSGWALGIAMPVEAVDAAAWRTLWLAIAMVLLAVGIAVGLAVPIGRRIERPIAALAQGAEAARLGEHPEFPRHTPIAELDSLAVALGQAAAAARERHELIEREKAALQAADRAKDEFLAMLSHELRNPLAALTTAAHVLKLAKPDQAAAIKARAVVERQTKHMARLVGDLLDISRVAMGKVTLERERINLADVVGNLINVWRASGRLERHQLHHLAMVPIWVDADRARIEQVVSNLLDNAIKFTPGGKEISVGVRHENEIAVVTISDEGEGLSAEATERMFDLFVQGERGLDRAAGGLGVGLALVKRLTELHGGSVSATSPGPGRGATFTVRLPAVMPPAQSATVAAPGYVGPLRDILIIEDNDDTRQMLHDALALSGHHVHEARDGASGLALAAATHPDVALIDIGLPDLDGYELARRLRAAPGGRRMGLIALTGYGQAEDQRRAFEAGFDAHLTKPVAPERLKQVMAGLP